MIATSDTCPPTEAIRSGKKQGYPPYRCGLLLVYEPTLDQNLAVLPQDPCGGQSQRLLRDVFTKGGVESRGCVRL